MNRNRWVLVWAVTLVLILSGGYALKARDDNHFRRVIAAQNRLLAGQAELLCRAENNGRAQIRDTVTFIFTPRPGQPPRPAEAQAQIDAFTADLFKSLQPIPCTKAAS